MGLTGAQFMIFFIMNQNYFWNTVSSTASPLNPSYSLNIRPFPPEYSFDSHIMSVKFKRILLR